MKKLVIVAFFVSGCTTLSPPEYSTISPQCEETIAAQYSLSETPEMARIRRSCWQFNPSAFKSWHCADGYCDNQPPNGLAFKPLTKGTTK